MRFMRIYPYVCMYISLYRKLSLKTLAEFSGLTGQGLTTLAEFSGSLAGLAALQDKDLRLLPS